MLLNALGKSCRTYCNRSFACAALLALAVPAWAGPNVLLLWDDDDSSVTSHPPAVSELNAGTQSLVAALEAADIAVTLSDHTQSLYNGNNPAPDDFDAVIHLNGNTTSTLDVMATSAVADLVNYVQNLGGAIVTSENTEAQIEIPSVGLTVLMEDLMVLDRQAGAPPAYGNMTLSAVSGQEGHPLLTGITTPITFTGARMVSAVRGYGSDPATVIMTDELGRDAAAVRNFGAGRVVSFHHAGNFHSVGTFSPTLQDANVQRLYINAVLWGDQKFPTAVEIERENANGIADASGARFRVKFSEGVSGLDASDLQIIAGGGISYNHTPQITALSDRDYRVTVQLFGGTGTIALNLLDDDSIQDKSFAQHPLGSAGSGNGALTGPVYVADAVFPDITAFTPNPLIVALDDRSVFTIEFSEAMDTAYPPVVDVHTNAGGTIHASSATPDPGNRVTSGLLALYTFEEGTGNTVSDVSGVGTPLDLSIAAQANTTWLDGGLSIDSSTILLSAGAASKIISACQSSDEITIETWITPENNTQTGPALIASLSAGINTRDVTLEQNAAAYEARLRTGGNTNGNPPLSAAGSVNPAGVQHVVYTRDSAGNAKIYVDNNVAATTTSAGDFSTWATTYRLAVGNELSQNRPWLGDLYLLAIYDRALTPTEVAQNFDEGPATAHTGDGTWLNPTTYEVSMDRNSTIEDQGSATVAISGARDVAGNEIAPDASNTIGIISGSLTVLQSPATSYLREAGTPFEFFVVVSGAIGGLNYQWYKEDAAKVFQPLGTNAPSLPFASLEMTDSGTYYCVITDTQSETQTLPSHLEVVAQLPLGGAALLGAISAVLACGCLALRSRRAM